MLRKSLGRGLDALFESTIETPPGEGPAHQPAAQERALTMIAVGRIAPGPFQPRRHFDALKLQELKRAIEAQGIIEPLVVRPRASAGADGMPHYELIAGERRLRAAREAGLATVPVIVRALDDRAALEMSLVENLAREELNPIDEGRALRRLHLDFNLSHEEIAVRVGKSRPYVSNAVRILELPAPILAMVESGRLSPGQVRPLLAIESAEAQIAAANRIAEHGITARGAEAIATEHKARRTPAGHSVPVERDANLAALAESLQRALKRKVRIHRRRGKSPGRIEIEYYDDHDLTALATTLTASPSRG
ncbi:MAG TPA: ParB/RepB/Spo0J family partition protein [Candidatus Binataceae bacterium]|nr:ParB/RepB/Spo0J family partition protein [Candidatus Binataceae bacterium]